MSSPKTKTEHSGAKNGGGYWGTREEAKALSKTQRRKNDKTEVKKQLHDLNAEKKNHRSKEGRWGRHYFQ